MLQKTKPSTRISHIIRFLSSRRKVNPPTLKDIVDHLNNNPDSTKEVSLRTVERALNDIREKLGIKVHCESIKGKHVYTIDDSNELPMIDEEDKSDLGILLRLINTHEELQSVHWLKSMLIEDFGMREDHFKNDELFVLPKPIIKNHDKILKLAMELVRYAKLETVIQFFYQREKTIENTQLRLVAPMQVRYYDGRY
jgi:predicted DNA-binding transcriptional regulator YafY